MDGKACVNHGPYYIVIATKSREAKEVEMEQTEFMDRWISLEHKYGQGSVTSMIEYIQDACERNEEYREDLMRKNIFDVVERLLEMEIKK